MGLNPNNINNVDSVKILEASNLDGIDPSARTDIGDSHAGRLQETLSGSKKQLR